MNLSLFESKMLESGYRVLLILAACLAYGVLFASAVLLFEGMNPLAGNISERISEEW
jgi:hypothetical protein